MAQLKYQRVLLKISGEALAGEKHFGFDFDIVSRVCDVIKQCTEMGVQIGVVIGGGNFWRGVKNGEGYIERTRADHMGMLATAMNCMAVADVLEQKGVDVRIQTALEIKEVAEPYINADPAKVANAKKYDAISYEDVLAQHLAVMDSTATSLSMDNHIPVLVFALKDPENIIRAIRGEKIGTIVGEE